MALNTNLFFSQQQQPQQSGGNFMDQLMGMMRLRDMKENREEVLRERQIQEQVRQAFVQGGGDMGQTLELLRTSGDPATYLTYADRMLGQMTQQTNLVRSNLSLIEEAMEDTDPALRPIIYAARRNQIVQQMPQMEAYLPPEYDEGYFQGAIQRAASTADQAERNRLLLQQAEFDTARQPIEADQADLLFAQGQEDRTLDLQDEATERERKDLLFEQAQQTGEIDPAYARNWISANAPGQSIETLPAEQFLAMQEDYFQSRSTAQPQRTALQRVQIQDPNDPSKPLLAGYDPYTNTYYDQQGTPIPNAQLWEDADDPTGIQTISSEMPPEYEGALRRAVSSAPGTRVENIADSANFFWEQGDEEGLRDFIRQMATENELADDRRMIRGRAVAIREMTELQNLITEMEAEGISTNRLRGSAEDIMRLAGTTSEPRLAYFANRVAQSLLTYRRAMTGVQFGQTEAGEYAKLFPSYGNTAPLNQSLLNGLIDAMDIQDRAYWDDKLGQYAPMAYANPDGTGAGTGEPSASDLLNELRELLEPPQ